MAVPETEIRERVAHSARGAALDVRESEGDCRTVSHFSCSDRKMTGYLDTWKIEGRQSGPRIQ